MQGKRVVDAVAKEGNAAAVEPLDTDDPCLVLGTDPGEHGGGCDRRRQLGVVETVRIRPGQSSIRTQPEVMAHLDRDCGTVACEHLDRDPQAVQSPQRLGCIRLGGI
jgi:hypothetical protein